MESNHTMSYDVDKSSERMDEILNASDNDYCDKDSIPARSDLTFKNGYYVNVTAIFIEILYLIFDYPHKHYTFKHFEV